ncbi:MAG: TraI domain-containing protein [Gammaproteobacteria bacterium]|nr:TraI domain-containing protein [Gammaproteobacteria bacterium]
MFERPRKKVNHNAHLHGLTTIVPANQLILKHKRPEQITALAETCQFKPPRFTTLCQTLFYHLLNYTQQLPETTNSYFSSPGGAFDHALSRTKAASDLFQTFLLQEPHAELSEEQQLWWYALFSAGLLRGIGKLPLDYAIELYNPHGHLIKTWEPLLEPLINTGYAYKFDTVNNNQDETFRQRLNIILAQQLMPKEGFTWLTTNLNVFEVWLALLHEDSASSGSLGLILDRADAIAIQEDLINLPPGIYNPKKTGGRTNSFIDTPGDSLIEREQFVGAEFVKWLLANLEASKLTFNQHPLINVAGGTLIGPDAFKLFVRESPMFKNWLAVKQGVMSLDLHDKTPGITDDKSLILKGSIALPAKFQHQASKNAAPTETNAIEARHPGSLKKLSADGHWKTIEKKQTSSLSPKNTPYD